MSFGLLTALRLEDIPRILKTCSMHYRDTETRYYPEAWRKIADKVEAFALELEVAIPQMKREEPPRKKPRVRI